MKIAQFIFSFLLVIFLCGFGCSSSKPAPDPLAGFRVAALYTPDTNKAITDNYKDYIQQLPSEERKYLGPIFFFEGRTGQHAVRIETNENNESWYHILIYDKENKRIKTIKYYNGRYQS